MAVKRKKTKTKSQSKFRASWRGQLRFGLVSFEVQAVNAEIKENAEVHFHLLHEPDHRRIHFAKVCPKPGLGRVLQPVGCKCRSAADH
jgi:non-homologous end joining protein Ku